MIIYNNSLGYCGYFRTPGDVQRCFVSLRKGHISELVAVSAGPDKVDIRWGIRRSVLSDTLG